MADSHRRTDTGCESTDVRPRRVKFTEIEEKMGVPGAGAVGSSRPMAVVFQFGKMRRL